MINSTYEFHFHFNIPDEDTINRINAVLAAQKYSKLTISHMKPTVVTETNYRPDGTVDYERKTAGISDISFSGEMEEHHSGYDYRLYITLLSRSVDRGSERFRERWTRLHVYSTMCQMIQYEFEEGYVYIVLYHDGSSEEVMERSEINSDMSKTADEDYDAESAEEEDEITLGWLKRLQKEIEKEH